MQSARTLLPLALAISAALLAGCASKDKSEPAPELTGTPFEVKEFAPDMRDHHTSWGHSGRGGAALRKPTYQPVLGSLDVLETRHGKLHPELQYQPKNLDVSIAVPPALAAGTCSQEVRATQDTGVITYPVGASNNEDSHSIYTLANSRGTVNEYIQVRNKLCKGAERLTYAEWEILVMGTPKDIPLTLQPNQIKAVK